MRRLFVMMGAISAMVILVACGGGDTPAAKAPARSAVAAPANTPSPAPAKPSFAAGSAMDQIVKRGSLRVASTKDRPLVRYLDPITNKLSGFEIDLIEQIALKLFGDRAKYEIVDTEFAARIPAVQQGVVDLSVAGFFVTPERAQVVDFSDIYYTGGVTALVPAGSPVQNKAGLDGKKLIVTKATAAETTAKQQFPKSELLGLDSVPIGFEALRSGRGEALIGGDDLLAGLAFSQTGYRLLPDLISCSPTAVVLKKDQKDLVEFVNGVIREYKSSGAWLQSWKNNYGKFITGPAPTPPPNSNDIKAACP